MEGREALVAFDLLVIDFFAILEGAKAVSFDAGVVDEDVLAFGVDDEAETLLDVEPLHRANQHRSSHKVATHEMGRQAVRLLDNCSAASAPTDGREIRRDIKTMPLLR